MAKFYKCVHCANLVTTILDGGVTPSCCGEPMTLLASGSTDGALEKHVPVIEKDGKSVTVKVGSVPHPMTEEHYIQFIALENGAGDVIRIVKLTPADEPEAKFNVCDPSAPVTAYEYCNLHGLWQAEG
ncbi:MAG: desulfoferrodoxin [Clostridiales Family XIII bacterium]|nr:desulfoferrodoxin [Clostridiales Family XIII bacterium]